mgnify:CR=1 FL=1
MQSTNESGQISCEGKLAWQRFSASLFEKRNSNIVSGDARENSSRVDMSTLLSHNGNFLLS